MQEGDRIVIGSVGAQVFIAKVDAAAAAPPALVAQLATKIDPAEIKRRAIEAAGKPSVSVRKRPEFNRNPYVVAGAVLRAAGACEMPGCAIPLFTRDDGSRFLEVHHVTPLGEGGDDTLINAAALCPMCHRELHFGAARGPKRAALATAIASATAALA